MRTSARWLMLFLLSFASGSPVLHAETGSLPSDQVTISDVKVRISDHGPVVLLQAEGRCQADDAGPDDRDVDVPGVVHGVVMSPVWAGRNIGTNRRSGARGSIARRPAGGNHPAI